MQHILSAQTGPRGNRTGQSYPKTRPVSAGARTGASPGRGRQPGPIEHIQASSQNRNLNGGVSSMFSFIAAHWLEMWLAFLQHAQIVGIALAIAICTGVPIGIAITFNRRAADTVLYIAGIIMTIPSMALFGLMIPILAVWDLGIGKVPAIIALVLYSQLPVVRNTYAAIKNIDPAMVDAGRGMGMTGRQIMLRVQVPLALGVIFAGVRVAVVMSIGIAALAAYIGAGGLGNYIFRGIASTHDEMLFAGAFAVSVMAILADLVFGWLEKSLMSKGLTGGRP